MYKRQITELVNSIDDALFYECTQTLGDGIVVKRRAVPFCIKVILSSPFRTHSDAEEHREYCINLLKNLSVTNSDGAYLFDAEMIEKQIDSAEVDNKNIPSLFAVTQSLCQVEGQRCEPIARLKNIYLTDPIVQQVRDQSQHLGGDGLPNICLLYTSPSPRD